MKSDRNLTKCSSDAPLHILSRYQTLGSADYVGDINTGSLNLRFFYFIEDINEEDLLVLILGGHIIK